MKLRPFKEFKTHLLYLFKYKIYFIGLSHGINSHLFKGQLMALGQSKRRPKRSVIFLSIQFSSIFCSKTTLATTTTAMTVVDMMMIGQQNCVTFSRWLCGSIKFSRKEKLFFFIFVLKMSAPLFLLFKREGKTIFQVCFQFSFQQNQFVFHWIDVGPVLILGFNFIIPPMKQTEGRL